MDLRLSGLRREVMAPRRPSSSFGLIAVSTMAMVFAVSSSLLLFSAHRHRRCHAPPAAISVHTAPRAAPDPAPPPMMRARAMAPAPMALPPPPADACKGPIYRSTADGHTEVVFEQCPARPFAKRPE